MSATESYRDWLGHHAAGSPAQEALVADDRRLTFAELDDAATTAARQLAAHGVRPGDRVATLLRNGIAPAVMVHAALRLGATLVPLNTRLGTTELAWQLADAGPRLLLTDAALRAQATAARGALPVAVFDDAGSLGANAGDTGALRTLHPAHHVLAIIYTSGTTGRPKGAMLTVGNFWWSAIGSALNLGTRPDDRWLACLPLFHVGGLSILLRAAIHGVTAVVLDGVNASEVSRTMDDERITMVSVVALTLQRLLDARGTRPLPPSLRCVLLGGGPAPRPLLERCAARGVPVVQTYGLTETASQLATLAPGDALRKLGSAGRALYPNEVRILADDGEAGEILVRGPVVMAGYADRPDDTARAITDGWLHTGDIGRVDAEGFLYVLDRRDDLIITGGENVYPAEVEAALLAHPTVLEAGVVGAPDEQWGQRVVGVVKLRATSSAEGAGDALIAHCRALLAGYKSPREIRIVTAPLPRTASGKLRRSELRDMLTDIAEPDVKPETASNE